MSDQQLSKGTTPNLHLVARMFGTTLTCYHLLLSMIQGITNSFLTRKTSLSISEKKNSKMEMMK
jgi:hypothetical protein